MKSFSLEFSRKKVVVGKNNNVIINQLTGSNNEADYTQGIEKINMWDNEEIGPDIITDVSLPYKTDLDPLWKYILQKGKYIVGTVPIYNYYNGNTINEAELVNDINYQLMQGVKIITLHLTPTYELIKLTKDRIVPCTSRGGAIVIRDMINNKKEKNIYLECLDDIIALCIKYGAAISIGTTFRPANIMDSLDEAQIKEIKMQMSFADYISEKGAKVIIEMPGHMPPHKIEKLNEMLQFNEYPIMPLGPVVTDIGIGLDHITSAIGLTLMGLKNNVQIITAMTSEEHTGNIPSIESTKEAVRTARMVAHIIDMERTGDYADDEQVAKSRKFTCIAYDDKLGCSRCEKACPLRMLND